MSLRILERCRTYAPSRAIALVSLECTCLPNKGEKMMVVMMLVMTAMLMLKVYGRIVAQ